MFVVVSWKQTILSNRLDVKTFQFEAVLFNLFFFFRIAYYLRFNLEVKDQYYSLTDFWITKRENEVKR